MSDVISNPNSATNAANSGDTRKETPDEQRRREIQERLAAIKREADKAKAEAVKKDSGTPVSTPAPAPASAPVSKPASAPVASAPAPQAAASAPAPQAVVPAPAASTSAPAASTPPVQNASTPSPTPVAATPPTSGTTVTPPAANNTAPTTGIKTTIKAASANPGATLKTEAAKVQTVIKSLEQRKWSKGLIIGGSAAILVIAIVIYFLLVPLHFRAVTHAVGLGKKEQVTNVATDDKLTTTDESKTVPLTNTGSSTIATNSNVAATSAGTSSTDANKTVAQPTTDANKTVAQPTNTDTKKTIVKEEPKKEKTKTPVPVKNTASTSGDKWGLSRPCFIITHSSYASEDHATKMVADLKKDGYDTGGYFYMPDYSSKSKQLYKVYVAVYQTRKEARAALKSVKSKYAQAWVEKVK